MKCIVSIIIPLFNKEKFIKETLKSVLAQTFKNWECIIVNDHSNDKSVEIVEKIIKIDKRFKFIQSNLDGRKGASAARNIGLEKAKGKYIQFLDADDILSNKKLEAQVNLLESSKLNSMVTCAWGRFECIENMKLFEDLKSYNNFDTSNLFLNSLIESKGYFPIHAYLIRRDIINLAGPWNEFLALNDDGEFIIRVITYSKQIKFATEVFVLYRLADGNNLSQFYNKESVLKAISSWKLIEVYLQIRYNKKENDYMEKSKKALYINVENSFPELVSENKYFFKKQIKESNFYNRLKIKLKYLSSKI